MPKISALHTIEHLTTSSVLPVVDGGETQKVSLQKVVEFVSASLEPTFATDIELLRSASAITSSLNAFASASVLSVATKLSTASFETYTASIQTINTGSFATTGSNHFTANQTIDGIIYTSQIQNLSGSIYIATPGNNVEIQGSNLVVPNGGISSAFNVSASSLTGSIDYSNLTNVPSLISGANQLINIGFATTNSLANVTPFLSSSIFNSYTSSNNTTNTTQNSRLTSLENNSGSYLLKSETGSFLTSIPNGIVSSSAQITSFGFISQSTDLTALNSFTSSIDTTIKNKLNNDNVISGSISYTSLTNIPNGIISSSWQLDNLGYAQTSLITGLNTRIEMANYLSSSVFNSFTSSYTIASSSFDSRIIAATNEQDLSGLVTTSSFNSYTSSNDSKVNSLINVTSSYLTSLPNGLVSGSSQILIGSGIYSSSAQLPSGLISGSSQISVLGYATTSSLNGVISSSIQITNYGFATTSSVLNIDTSSLVTTSSFNTFTSSYKTDSGSFDSRINAIATSGVPAGTISGSTQIIGLGFATTSSILNVDTSSLLTTASFNIHSASFDSRLDALEGYVDVDNYVTTSSFETYTASINLETASLITSINNLTNATASYEVKGSGILSGSIVTISETKPSSSVGNLWYDSTIGNMYLHYDTNTWVDTSNGVIQSIINDGSVLTTASFNSWTASYVASVPAGTISGSTQITNLGFVSGSYETTGRGIISSSAQLPSGLVSGSSQINGTQITNNIITIAGTSTALGGSITLGTITNGSGIISGSSQLSNLGFATTGSQTINGNLVVTGSITAQSLIFSSSVYYTTASFSSGSTIFGNSLDDTHQYTGSVSITGSLTINGGLTLSPSASLGAKLWQLSDVNDTASGSITNGYQLAWNSSNSQWEPTAGAAAKGTIRLYMATNRSNGNAFYFNANTRTASDSPSPSSDTAFMVTTALLSKVTVYLRQDGAGPNSTIVGVAKNANGSAFSTATLLATASLSLTQDTIQTYTFSGLTLNQFDSLHVYCDPASTPGTLYSIVTVE
jgi:hypothetical protein